VGYKHLPKPPPPPLRLAYGSKEAAAVVGVSKRTMDGWIAQRKVASSGQAAQGHTRRVCEDRH